MDARERQHFPFLPIIIFFLNFVKLVSVYFVNLFICFSWVFNVYFQCIGPDCVSH